MWKVVTLFAGLVVQCVSAQAVPWTVQIKNSAGQPLADAVVAIGVRGRPAKTSNAKAEMAQRDRQFAPQVLVIQTGTSVNFPNFDTVRHHVYSFSPIKVFETKLYSGTPSEPTIFDKPGIAALGCNIHDRMSAHIVVVDTALFAKTDASGMARFADLPAGEHQLKAWFSGMKTPTFHTQALSVGASSSVTTISLSE